MKNKLATLSLDYGNEFLNILRIERGLAPLSIEAYRQDLESLAHFLERTKAQLCDLDEEALLLYAVHQKKSGNSPRTLARRFSSLRSFFNYCTSENLLPFNPAQFLDSPKFVQNIPFVLSLKEIEKIFDAAAPEIATSTKDKSGLRDRVMLELLYASGLRVSELINMKLNDIEFKQSIIKTRGKGDKERFIPIHKNMCKSLKNYQQNIRPLFSPKSDYLFLNRSGNPVTRQYTWKMIKKYASIAGIQQEVSPHTFRHSFATHLLENGADLSAVQMLLGHADLTATQIYTHIKSARLESEIEKHHVRSK